MKVVFDKENLYLGYDVQDANGLKNDGHELPYAPFVSGGYVDFDIGPDWAAPNRETNLEGDVRVIMARIKGTNDYQMGFWPVKQELKKYSRPTKATHPQTIVSPVAQRHFDDVAPVEGLTFAYQTTASGYTLEARVPFASLGINPTRQPIVGFDASVAFSDAGGEVRTRAIHWAGESEAAVVDRPGSAELKPATWGTLQFDRTPLAPVGRRRCGGQVRQGLINRCQPLIRTAIFGLPRLYEPTDQPLRPVDRQGDIGVFVVAEGEVGGGGFVEWDDALDEIGGADCAGAQRLDGILAVFHAAVHGGQDDHAFAGEGGEGVDRNVLDVIGLENQPRPVAVK